MRSKVFHFCFYGYLDTNGNEVKHFNVQGLSLSALEELRCRDGLGRPYLQGYMVLRSPMTPIQVRRATNAPYLMLVEGDHKVLDRTERMRRYEEVMRQRGGVIYEPETLHIVGLKDVFNMQVEEETNTPPPVYSPRFVVKYL